MSEARLTEVTEGGEHGCFLSFQWALQTRRRTFVKTARKYSGFHLVSCLLFSMLVFCRGWGGGRGESRPCDEHPESRSQGSCILGVKSLLDAPLQRTKGAGSHLCQEVSSFRFSVLACPEPGILHHLQTKPGCTERGVNYSSCSLPLPLNC